MAESLQQPVRYRTVGFVDFVEEHDHTLVGLSVVDLIGAAPRRLLWVARLALGRALRLRWIRNARRTLLRSLRAALGIAPPKRPPQDTWPHEALFVQARLHLLLGSLPNVPIT